MRLILRSFLAASDIVFVLWKIQCTHSFKLIFKCSTLKSRNPPKFMVQIRVTLFHVSFKWWLFPSLGHGTWHDFTSMRYPSVSFSCLVSSQSLSLPIYALIGSSRHNTNSRTFLSLPSHDYPLPPLLPQRIWQLP